MADIIISKRPGLQVVVIDGDPPVDQSALVAELQAANAAHVQTIAALRTKLDAIAQVLAA